MLTKWLVDISIHTTPDTKKSLSSSNNTSSSDESKQRNQVAEQIRTLIESIISKTAQDHCTEEAQQKILNLEKGKRNFLQEMMDHSAWRNLLIDLSATFPNSPLFSLLLKEISKRGHHRDIAKRIQNQSDYFDVFHGMLVSELCRLGNTAVNGNVLSCKKLIVKQAGNDEDREWDIDTDALVDDLKRTCASTAYTYIYTIEVKLKLIDVIQ